MKHQYELETRLKIELTSLIINVGTVDLTNSTLNSVPLHNNEVKLPNLTSFEFIDGQEHLSYMFNMEIDISTGRIKNWKTTQKSKLIITPASTIVIGLHGKSIHYKKIPFKRYTLYQLGEIPALLRLLHPTDTNKISMSISKTGKIQNWNFDISEFLYPQEKYILDPVYIRLNKAIEQYNTKKSKSQ